MTPNELAAIRERANNATPGPWTWGDNRDGLGNKLHPAEYPGKYRPIADFEFTDDADAEFIAAARTDIPNLLDHIEVQASVIEALNAGVNNALSAKIHAVRELHTSVKPDSDGEHYLDPLTRKPKCGECLLIYPCPTIQALED